MNLSKLTSETRSARSYAPKLTPAIFLDRDGVINKWVHPGPDAKAEDFYVTKWEQFEFLPKVFDALRLLQSLGYKLIVISNQSGIDNPDVDCDWHSINQIFVRMRTELKEHGLDVMFKFCRHMPNAGCACRKPSPGMIYDVAVNINIDLSKSWMIGDQWSDINAGMNAGIRNLIVVSTKDMVGFGKVLKYPTLYKAAKHIENEP